MSIGQRSLVGSTNHRCNYCGFLMEPTARFCGGCGRPKARSSDAAPHALSFLQSNIPADLADRILRSGGAMLGECWKGRSLDTSWQVGQAAFWGRLLGTAGKLTAGAAIVAVILAGLALR